MATIPGFRFAPSALHLLNLLIEIVATLRLVHQSAWIARRWDDPALPAAFLWFKTPRNWKDKILELREHVAIMDEPPLWPA